MGGESFPSQKLIQLSDKIGSGATPRGGSSVYLESGEISLIRSQNILNNEFSVSGLVYIEPEAAEKLSNVVVQEDDVLLNITGDSVARCCQVNPKVLPARVNQHVAIIRPKKEILDPKYLRYFLVSPSMQNYMLGLAGAGATRNALTKGMIEDFDIPLPSIEVQESIAHILGTLDDKIELNRQMNATLEAMAQALFKSWFVDFDPVIDNALAAGNPIPEPLQARAEVRKALGDKRKPLPEEIQKQFPSSFVFSEEIGWVPEGWKVETLKNLTDKIGSGATPRGGSQVYQEDGTSLIRSQNVYDSTFVWDGLAHISEDAATQLKGVTVQANDVLLNITGASILRTCVVDPQALPARVNQHVAIIRAKEFIPPRYLHLHLLQKKTKDLLLGQNAGASREAVTKGHIEAVKALVPSNNLLQSFDIHTEHLFQKKDQLSVENNALTGLRDTLLPKLLSGQLRIPEAEKQLAEAI